MPAAGIISRLPAAVFQPEFNAHKFISIKLNFDLFIVNFVQIFILKQ